MIRILSAMILLFALLSPARAGESRAMLAVQQILDQAHTSATDCTRASEALVSILCAKQLRVGLRSYYPGFSVRDESNTFSGFEVDIARRIADFPGVRLVPVAVDTKTRIPLVSYGDIDLVIATMSHNVQRDGEVRFVRPHYYASQSVVVGARDSTVHDWGDLVGRTVCLPSGALANMIFIRHHIRILTFAQPEQLLDALEFNECAFVTHDNTFLYQGAHAPGVGEPLRGEVWLRTDAMGHGGGAQRSDAVCRVARRTERRVPR
jgi:polar amino acid transport system substrate-binding protein